MQPAQPMTFVAAARMWLLRFGAALAPFQLSVSPALGVEQGRHLLCAYQFDTQQIAISFPEPGDSKTMLHRLLLRELLCCPSDAELTRFLHCLLPYVVAHELTHHLRHHYGLLTADSWHEEEVANECASALTKLAYGAEDRAFVLPILARSRAHLAGRLAAPHPLHQHMRYMHAHIEWLHGDLLSPAAPDLARCLRRHFTPALRRAADALAVER